MVTNPNKAINEYSLYQMHNKANIKNSRPVTVLVFRFLKSEDAK